MNREEKIKLAIEKGYTCDPITGKVYGVTGKELTGKKDGYNYIKIESKNILSHQFIYYWVYKEVVDCIDHINGVKDDNRIENLREVTNQQNTFNTKAKGYGWHKATNKWQSKIAVDKKQIYLGLFDTEQEARQAYLNAKKIYHII